MIEDLATRFVNAAMQFRETRADVAALPDSMPLSWVASRFVCKRCNHPGAYVLPNWTDAAPAAPSSPEEPGAEGSEPLA